MQMMNVPWLKPGAWGAVIGAVAMMIVGFSWLGWTLGSTAERMAMERTSSAVVVALTPSCVARFMQEPDAKAKLAEFLKIDSWKQREFVEAGGWATPRGEKNPNSGVASACADELAKSKA